MSIEQNRAGEPTGAGATDEFRRAVRAVLVRDTAPEALRARIAAMLAVEARLGP